MCFLVKKPGIFVGKFKSMAITREQKYAGTGPRGAAAVPLTAGCRAGPWSVPLCSTDSSTHRRSDAVDFIAEGPRDQLATRECAISSSMMHYRVRCAVLLLAAFCHSRLSLNSASINSLLPSAAAVSSSQFLLISCSTFSLQRSTSVT